MTTSPKKNRLDQILVERHLVSSREQAQRVIRAGQVRHGTEVLDKPGLKLEADIELEFRELRERFVSRGGFKLLAAIEAFRSLTPCPVVCADIGSSTGGFTDCLLQHGAQRVYAIDSGTGQLDISLRNDPRVVVMEKTNARFLKSTDLPEPVDLVVSDVSFISLRLILGPAKNLLRPLEGQIVVLVKPQFEAGPEKVGKGGVVRDPKVHREVLHGLIADFLPTLQLVGHGLIPSPLIGPAGNHEYLLWITQSPPASLDERVPDERIDKAIQDAFAIGKTE